MSAALDSWRHEKESAWLYGAVAAAEPDPTRKRLFQQLGAAAEEQAAHWGRSSAAGASAASKEFHPSLRARIVARLVKRFGPKAMRGVLAAMKLRGLSSYSTAPVVHGHPMPTSVHDFGSRHRNGVGGNNLRASVFGVNDGLVSNASLVMGVAGAGMAVDTVLTTGIAGLLAGALSMAAGEYVSVRSQREMYEYQIALERAELEEYPEEEAEELALIYESRGLNIDQARDIARALLAQPDQALGVLAREELGLNPDTLASPWQAAAYSFGSFAIGAALPLIPFGLHQPGNRALAMTAVIAALALAGVGLAISLFTGRNAWLGALRMVAIGGGAGLLSYLVGTALGVTLS
jgi:VIT1/CCC1 family predicted Fe2+/Mn2+ transporter